MDLMDPYNGAGGGGGASGLSCGRLRLGLGLLFALVLFLMAGPLSLSLHSDPDSLNWVNNDPFRHDSERLDGEKKNKKNRKKKKRRNEKLLDGGDFDHHFSMVDDDHHNRVRSGEKFQYAAANEYTKAKRTKEGERQPGAKLPVYDFSAESFDVVPDGVGESILTKPAYDALECRASVIDFVINATDIKDECDGLRKAFDKTCSAAPAPAVGNSDEAGVLPAGVGRRKRRLLGTEAESYRVESWGAYVSRLLTRLIPTSKEAEADLSDGSELGKHIGHRRSQRRLATEEIGEGELYGDDDVGIVDVSVGEIKRGYDREIFGEGGQSKPLVIKEGGESSGATGVMPLSPKLPTSSLHVADQMLNDAVTLAGGASNEAISMALNATDATASEVVHEGVAAAAADAQKSAEAVSQTTAAVSAVLNDESSVEARTCCASILNVFHEHCDHPDEDDFDDKRLFIIVFVIAVCSMVKSLIRHFKIRWLPEAAGCILVGVTGGLILQYLPHNDFSFDGDMFLRVMVPPIVFEAALSIDKSSLFLHFGPIIIYSILGTIFSTFLTAAIVAKGSFLLPNEVCPTIPFVESLTFGALISSIDPIAVLSVLNSMGMDDTDAIYVLIFGESLLNDGVAIVLFQTLVHFLDDALVIDGHAAWAAACHFVVVGVGSVFIGLISGACCTCYFYFMRGMQTPLVEVLIFLCWAFIPYYICDGVEWSGIVAIVAAGLVMDLYVVGQTSKTGTDESTLSPNSGNGGSTKNGYSLRGPRRSRIFTLDGHLSEVAKSHIHFVTEINATLMETAIFSYLGLFLFNSRYHWNYGLCFIAILSCVLSRAIMVPALSFVANWFNGISILTTIRSFNMASLSSSNRSIDGSVMSEKRLGVFIDFRMQIVLWFAGLRGAMSFALVENIPLFDTVTGQGSRMKPELKAMTSASIVFSVFVLGGLTSYITERLGMSLKRDEHMLEMGTSLVRDAKERNGTSDGLPLVERGKDNDSGEGISVRQRGGGRRSSPRK